MRKLTRVQDNKGIENGVMEMRERTTSLAARVKKKNILNLTTGAHEIILPISCESVFR